MRILSDGATGLQVVEKAVCPSGYIEWYMVSELLQQSCLVMVHGNIPCSSHNPHESYLMQSPPHGKGTELDWAASRDYHSFSMYE